MRNILIIVWQLLQVGDGYGCVYLIGILVNQAFGYGNVVARILMSY